MNPSSYGPKRDEVREKWTLVFFAKYQEDEVGGAGSTHGRDGKWTRHFSRNTRREETTWKYLDVYRITILEGNESGYGLDDWMLGVRFPAGAGNFCHHCVQTGSGAHPASYTMGTGGLSQGVRRPGNKADNSPPSSAEVKERVELYLKSPIRLHGVVLS